MSLAAAPVVIRLSTVAPAGTTWDTALKDMGAAWSKATEAPRHAQSDRRRQPGQRDDRHSSTCGRKSTPSTPRLLTANGLADIDDAFNVFGIPFFFQSDDEEQAVRAKLEPVLAKRLEAKHFHLLSWGHGGWVQLFSTVAGQFAGRREEKPSSSRAPATPP